MCSLFPSFSLYPPSLRLCASVCVRVILDHAQRKNDRKAKRKVFGKKPELKIRMSVHSSKEEEHMLYFKSQIYIYYVHSTAIIMRKRGKRDEWHRHKSRNKEKENDNGSGGRQHIDDAKGKPEK